MLLVRDLGPNRFHVFFFLGFPIIHSALLVAFFYLNFDPFFFPSSFAPLLGVFPLFIYLSFDSI